MLPAGPVSAYGFSRIASEFEQPETVYWQHPPRIALRNWQSDFGDLPVAAARTD